MFRAIELGNYLRTSNYYFADARRRRGKSIAAFRAMFLRRSLNEPLEIRGTYVEHGFTKNIHHFDFSRCCSTITHKHRVFKISEILSKSTGFGPPVGAILQILIRILLLLSDPVQCCTVTVEPGEICFSQSVRGYELRNRIGCIIFRFLILGNRKEYKEHGERRHED